MHKILYLSPSVSLLGARRSLLVLLEGLNKNKYFPIVVCSKEGDLVEELKNRKIRTEILRFHGWRKLKNIQYIPSTIVSLVKLIKKEKISLIHCNEFWLNPYVILTAKMTKIPCITHIRTLIDKNKVRQYFLARADKLITVSDSIRKPLNGFSRISNKTITVYNGVDIRKFKPNSRGNKIRAEFNIPKEEVVVGTIGQLYPDKGQKTFLEAIAIVLAKKKLIRALIVGMAKKKKYEIELRKLAKNLNLQSKVIFTGFREDIPEILNAMDIFVLPSLKEGFSRSIIEAMAVSKPVIATSVGGNSEAIIDGVTGFIIPLNNPQILAERILELLDDRSKMQKMGEKGRERVEENFTAEHYVENIEKVYNEFLR